MLVERTTSPAREKGERERRSGAHANDERADFRSKGEKGVRVEWSPHQGREEASPTHIFRGSNELNRI